MKLRRRMAVRIIGVAVAMFLLGITMVLGTSRVLTRDASSQRLARLMRHTFGEQEAAGCHRGEMQRIHTPSGVILDLYDATGAPLHADAELLDREMVEQATDPAAIASRFEARKWRTRVVWRVNAGRCAIVQATLSPLRGSVVDVLVILVSAMMLAAFVLALLTFLFIVRPLLVRFAGLGKRARDLGTPAYVADMAWSDEAGDIARALDTTHERLVEAQRRLAERNVALESFLAETMHDIRTPLASLQLALDEVADVAPAEAEPALQRALNDTMYIGSLAQNLRILTRLEGGWSPFGSDAPVDIIGIARRVLQRLHPFAVRRGITLTNQLVEAKALVRGDATAVEQIFANLLENAITHCGPGVHVEVTIAMHDDVAIIKVQDDGPGVSSDQLPLLGTRGREAIRSRSRSGRSEGIGLSITRELCNRLQWKLSFRSAEPRGLVVTMEAQLVREPQG